MDALAMVISIVSLLILNVDCIRTSLGSNGHFVCESKSGETFEFYPNAKDNSKTMLTTKDQTKCELYEDDKLINEVPIKAAMQTMNVLNNKDLFFPNDKLTNKELEDAAKLSALSFYAYYPDKAIGDRFYGGTIAQIIKFNASLIVDLDGHAQDIDGGELFAYRWESDDNMTSVIVFRGVECSPNWSICFNTKAIAVDSKQFDFDDEPFIGLYHSGFYNIMNDHFDVFSPLISSINMDKGREIIFSGHSMGSALAQTMSLMVFRHDWADWRAELQSNDMRLRVQTFEGPVVCDELFAANLEKALDNLNDNGVKSMQVFEKKNDPVSFEGEDGIKFLNNVISNETNVSLAEYYIRFKIKSEIYIEQMIRDGMDDIVKYTHIGGEIMIDTANEISCPEHGEALNAFLLDLSANGNDGWMVKKKED